MKTPDDEKPEPEWARPAWVAANFGTPRTTIYEWIKANLIISASFRKTGQRKGQRLINVQSVRDCIEAHVVTGKPEGDAE